jgi:hypothetical protein
VKEKDVAAAALPSTKQQPFIFWRAASLGVAISGWEPNNG